MPSEAEEPVVLPRHSLPRETARLNLVARIKARWKQNQAADAQAAVHEHSDWRSDKSFVLDLAFEEYCLRTEAGEPVDPIAFCDRFPPFKNSLRRLLEAHQLLEENAHLLADQPISWPEPGTPYLCYEILRELGRGSFARVYLAREPALGNRLVVLKVSRAGGAEAETLGKLRHPNIVPVLTVHRVDANGLVVICMPFLGSATLCDVFDHAFSQPGLPEKSQSILNAIADSSDDSPEARPPPSDLARGSFIDGVIQLAVQLSDALAYVHAQGIYHRDLKPSNILITPAGRPMILDFNLCFDEQVAGHRLGGTLPYMSPEQIQAMGSEDAPPVTAGSDVFSLGVILFELLTGVHPFGPIPTLSTLAELRCHLLTRQQEGHRSLRAINGRVNRSLARLIERCLSASPADRPSSAAKLAQCFRKQQAASRRAIRGLSRYPKTAAVVFLAVCALTIAATVHLATRKPYGIRQLETGLALYESNQYEPSLRCFDEALRADSQLVEARYARARTHQALGNINAALIDYKKVVDETNDPRAVACFAYCLSLESNHGHAIKNYTKAIKLGFHSPAVYSNLGYSLSQLGRLEEAEEYLNQAIKLDPQFHQAFRIRAINTLKRSIKGDLVDITKGAEDIAKAIHLAPPSADLYRDAAYIYAVASRDNKFFEEAALNYLALSLEAGQNPQPLNNNSFFSSLRENPEFQRLFTIPRSPRSESADPPLVDPGEN